MKPIFTIIIPVYNEEDIINNTINNVNKITGNNRIEILVVDSHPNNTTIKNINTKNIIKLTSNRGRGSQMNTGAKKSKGDILIFLHADTILPLNAFDEIYNIVIKRKIKAGAFDLSIDSKKKIFRIIEKLSSIRSWITRVPYGDQVHFFEKKFFFDLGMYKNIPIMEDVEIMKRIKKAKSKIKIIPKKIITSARRWENEGILRCTIRNWMLITLYTIGINPEKLIRFYR